jgi:hypothetical protein
MNNFLCYIYSKMSKSKQFRRSQRKQRQHKGGDASQYVSSVVGGIGEQTAMPGTNVIAMKDLSVPSVIETKGGALVALTPATIETPLVAPVKGGATIPLTGVTSPSAGDASIDPWKSSNINLATVSDLGVVTGVSFGTITITYTNSNACKANSLRQQQLR